MKKLILLSLIFMPMLFFSQENKGLSFKTTSHDFGIINSKSNAKATFNFTNTSESIVEILKVHGENRCIVIDSLSVRSYAPKEKGTITITYDSDCKGPIRKTVSVFTSNKNNTISLKLIGKVVD